MPHYDLIHAFTGATLSVPTDSKDCTVGHIRSLARKLDRKESNGWICDGTAFDSHMSLVLYESGHNITGHGHIQSKTKEGQLNIEITVSGQCTEPGLNGETKLVLATGQWTCINDNGQFAMGQWTKDFGNGSMDFAMGQWTKTLAMGTKLKGSASDESRVNCIVRRAVADVVLLDGEYVLPDQLVFKSIYEGDGSIKYGHRSENDMKVMQNTALLAWCQRESKAFSADYSCRNLSDALFGHQFALTVADSMLSNATAVAAAKGRYSLEENMPGGFPFKHEASWSLSARHGSICLQIADCCMQWGSAVEFADDFANLSEQAVSRLFVCCSGPVSSISRTEGTLLKKDLEQLARRLPQ